MSIFWIAFWMGVYYWFARLRFGSTFSAMLLQPVVVGVFVGLLTGNMMDSMKIGAYLQLIYLGVTSTPGGNVPNDPALAACIAIPLGVLSNMTPEAAAMLAVPFGILGVFVEQLKRSSNSLWLHLGDRYAEKADTRGIMLSAFVFPSLLQILIRFPIVFIINYYGVEVANSILEFLPDVIIHSFEIMGGILPALGFAITIMVIGRKELIPFFIVGFFAVQYLGIDIVGMSIFSICIALIIQVITVYGQKGVEFNE